ncbi:ABC transporter substrate-binding protein [Noviherbaspirillum pedocola]|uniref:ABC transporter substrate-binding protein n=1 Tax=Noviherbaspirillum pedocola TaxID=2801341 RepID=A0A934W7C1_9BURK|nr:ABC transporter substrate-binding protein [Noviherbaspirillum pedocola]MBK4735388.1 ABC transporter substrate-binding protein [Noviherbaspirillum pedocola]
MKISTLFRYAFSLAAGLAAISIAHADDKVRVGVFASSSALPYFVGLERGYFKEAGIAVETVTLASAPLIVQSLVTGDIDAASNLVTLEGANISQRRPNTLTYISLNGQNAQYITEQFVVKAGSAAKSLKDLKGAKLFSAPGPANIGTAKAVLKAAGLEENRDYTIQEQQLSVHLGALQAGTFDGGYTLEPVASTMIKQGVARRLEAGLISTYLLGNASAQAYAAGGALSNKLLAERPDVAARFAKAWAKSVAAANTDPSARELLAKDMNVPAQLASTVPLANFVMVRDMSASQKADFQKFVDIGVGLGVVKGAIDTATIIKGM